MSLHLKAKKMINELSAASPKLNILSLEDSVLDFKMMCLQLTDAGFQFHINRVETESDFEIALRSNSYDIILADFNLPGFDSFGALELCTNLCPNVPFICVSGSMEEEDAIKLLQLGAVDYVIKDRPERLPFAIRRALNEAKEKLIRREAEEALLQSEENYRHSIAESPLGIRIIKMDGETIYANKAFLDIYEFNCLEEFNNAPAIVRYTPDSYSQHQKRKTKRATGEEVSNYELSIVRKNGEIRHIKVSRKEVLWNGSKHYQVINQDITEQKNLTDELIISKEKAEESDRLKSAFLANMSHEIRTPMNGILGFTELLKEPDLTGENQQLYIEIIEKSGMRLLNIINDIIGISRIESGELELNLIETNINDLISFIYNTFRSELEIRNIQFETSKALQDMDAFIKTDREKLKTILTNLIKNAIKFTHSGSIVFGYQLKPLDKKTKGIPSATQELDFFVKDTGIGISLEKQKHIFERFRQGSENLTRSYEGAGLGLSITKAYVEFMGGKIWVESEVYKGSTFYFTIPVQTIKISEITIDF